MVAAIVVVASSLSALVAYRRALRRPAPGPASGSATSASSGSLTGDCADFHDAGAHTGETGCVTGRVLRVYTSRAGNTFLDFCPEYRSCPFTSVIFASDRARFGNLAALEGRQVEIHGPITTYQGRAEIIIRDPQQIRAQP